MKTRSYIDLEIEGDPVHAVAVGEDIGGWWALLECGRKNGQEDTHASGVAVRSSQGEWTWCVHEGQTFSKYNDPEQAVDILRFLNAHDQEFLSLAKVAEWQIFR